MLLIYLELKIVYVLIFLYKNMIYEGFKINVIGDHNLLNALSGITFSLISDIDICKTKEALLDFYLPKRRFEIKGQRYGIKIIEDYAHHPTEIKALIDMTKSVTKGKIYCFFNLILIVEHYFCLMNSQKVLMELKNLYYLIYMIRGEKTYGVLQL